MANHKLMCLFIIALVVATKPANGAVTCGTMASSLAPCLPFLTDGATGVVPSGCCAGIKSLNSAAQSTPDRKMVCQCLKTAAKAMPNVNIGKAASIPPKCGVKLPYKLDPSTDCNS